MRILVIGAGAMGGAYGAALALAGHDVTLCDTDTAHVAAINAHGLRVDGVGGDHVVHAPAVRDASGLGSFALALVFVPSGATTAAADIAAGALAAGGVALTLQNGIGNVEALTARLGASRVVAGVTHNSASRIGPGHVRHTNRGPSWIGALGRADSPDALARTLTAAGFETHVVGDIHAHIWSKFALNAAINPVSALTGLRPGEIWRTPAARTLFERLLDEILMVAAAKGVRLAEEEPRAAIAAHCRVRYNRPSMLQHVEAGHPTEIDALNGALVREAEALGVAAPFNAAVTFAVKGLEAARARAVFGPPLDEAALEDAARAEEPS